MESVWENLSALYAAEEKSKSKNPQAEGRPLSARYEGLADHYARFIQERQLKDVSEWKKFVGVFRTHADIADEGWRGEYWGKMMRGACLTYLYTKDEALYGILEDTAEDLLSAQDELGRISAYDVAHEFTGWDMWGRKYVLTGLQHFYAVCQSGALRGRILRAMRRHADYIVAKIGVGEGQTPIQCTSEWWGGVNSCSILEPFVQLYKLTGDKKYLAFAEYIISTGGCGAGNMIEYIRGGGYPYRFPVTKAYETMSFFEGLIACYEVTGKEEYLNTAVKFAESVYESDITEIGCAGCTHELFDHAAEKQTEYSETIMQETCVTVTWMRLCARLWKVTRDPKYIDRIERSALNALYGSINDCGCDMFSFEKKSYMHGLPFDSYSPLYNNTRGRGIGGFKEFPEGGFYGCCACIGAAGTALYPLYAAAQCADVFYLNFFLNGSAEGETPQGQKIVFRFCTDYPAGGKFRAEIRLERPEKFGIGVRIPEWCARGVIVCGGKRVAARSGYHTLFREWKEGDVLELELPQELRVKQKNGRKCFSYGPLILARDEYKEGGAVLTDQFIYRTRSGRPVFGRIPAEGQEQIRLKLETAGGSAILLTDYASCGKHWTDKNNRITVWMNAEASEQE